MKQRQNMLWFLSVMCLFCGSVVNCGPNESGKEKLKEGIRKEAVAESDAGTQEPGAPDQGTPDNNSPQEQDTSDGGGSGDAGTPDRPTMGKRPFPKGLNILFVGHSFFIPPSRGYRDIAEHSEHKDAFPNHVYNSVRRGGQKGSPGALWNDTTARKSILKILATGKVEVMSMTANTTGSEQKDYQRWIDEALKANPNTKFMIGMPWPGEGAKKTAEAYTKENEDNAELFFNGLIAPLRKANKGVEIHFLNHGKIATLIKARFSDGKLKSATKECCAADAVFDDEFGHGGNLIDQTAGYLFLSYWTGFLSLSQKVFAKNDAAEMTSIVKEALQYNRSKGFLLK